MNARGWIAWDIYPAFHIRIHFDPIGKCIPVDPPAIILLKYCSTATVLHALNGF
jgi:hypothetical protein